MKFICTKENLVYVLDLVGGIASKHISLPILANVLIQVSDSKVELITTNLEMALKVNLRAKVEKTGAFTVPAKTLVDFVHLLSEEQITIEQLENELFLQCGRSSTKIKGLPADEYPVVPQVEEEHGYTINADLLRVSLSQAAVAAAKNEIRPELAGVCFSLFSERFSGLVLAATDSYRLAEKKVKVEQGGGEWKSIVPARAVQEMVRLLSLAKNRQSESQVRLWLSENQAALRFDDFELTSRLVEGKYPEYTQIIPSQFKTAAVFPIDLMANKIKAASLFTTSGVNAVAFDLKAGEGAIAISSTSTQTGEHSSEIDVEIKGEENSILLNHRYVLDGLQQMEAEEAEFKVNSGDSPCLFQPKGDDNYLYIVMPIRK